MRERTHGHMGIDHPRSGEQGSGEQGSRARAPRRAASGPRPVRPPATSGSVRPEAGPRPVLAEIGAGELDVDVAGPGAAGYGRPQREVGSGAPGRPGSCGRTAEGVRLRPRSTAVVCGPRVLARGAAAPAPRRAERGRRIAAGVVVVLAAAAVVFGLGRLADATSYARASDASPVAESPLAEGAVGEGAVGEGAVGEGAVGEGAVGEGAVGEGAVGEGAVGEGAVAEVTVAVHAPGTVWDVVDRVAPGVSGPQRAAMVDRTVAVNALTSVRVWPGEVLRVPLR